MRRTPEEELIVQALSGVETPEYDIAGAVTRQRGAAPQGGRRRPLPRAALIAACLTLALAAVASAVAGISAHWGLFFGGSPIPTDAVTTVGVSQTAGDYTLTLEDAVVDDNGVLILLALTRADGGAVDPGAGVQGGGMWTKFLAEGERFRGGGGLQGRRLSEDGNTLYLCYESVDKSLRGEEGLLGKKLTFEAGCVAKGIYHWGEDLRPLWPGWRFPRCPLAGSWTRSMKRRWPPPWRPRRSVCPCPWTTPSPSTGSAGR